MGMSPKMPPVAAFRLLADLNQFLAHSPEERQSALDTWVDSLEQRTSMLQVLETDTDAAAQDRAEAATVLSQAIGKALVTIEDASARAKDIVATANAQAESINRTVAENVAKVEAEAETAAYEAEERHRDSSQNIDERALVCAEREDAVTDREEAVETLRAEAQASKAEYEELIESIGALQRRAPK